MNTSVEWIRMNGSRRGDRRGVHAVVMVGDSGAEAGPVAVVAANVHGDEVTGVQAVLALKERLTLLPFTGTIVMYPSLNPDGLAQRSRHVPEDGGDLNRMFPGRRNGSASEKLAAVIWEDLRSRKPDLLIDLHADSHRSVPYAIVDRPVRLSKGPRRLLAQRLQTLARATGLIVLREYPDDLYQRFSLDRSLAGAAVNLLSIPAVTVESGPRSIVSSESVQTAVDATLGVLAAGGLVSAALACPELDPDQIPWRRSTSPRAGKAGVLCPLIEPGLPFKRGHVLARITAVTGEIVDEVRAQEPGMVISWFDGCWVDQGSVLGTTAIRDGGEV